MKAQLIYSVAALATFPIVVNAQVDAENIGKITAKKNEVLHGQRIKELAPGKYSFLEWYFYRYCWQEGHCVNSEVLLLLLISKTLR